MFDFTRAFPCFGFFVPTIVTAVLALIIIRIVGRLVEAKMLLKAGQSRWRAYSTGAFQGFREWWDWGSHFRNPLNIKGFQRLAGAILLLFAELSYGQTSELSEKRQQTLPVTFDRSVFRPALNEPYEVRVMMPEPPPEGLSSFGVRVLFEHGRAELLGASAVSVSDSLYGDGPRARTPVIGFGRDFAGAKGMTPFDEKPPRTSTNALLFSVFLRNVSAEPYELRLGFFNTLGSTEQIFMSGNGRCLDDEIEFGSASVEPSTPPSIEPETTVALNRQSGLFEQVVHVRNPGSAPILGFYLGIKDIPATWVPWNVAGTAYGVPYLKVESSVPPSGSVSVRVEYRIPSRVPIGRPVYTLLESVPHIEVPNGDNHVLLQPRARLQGESLLLEFSTISDRLYEVQYSADLATWKTVSPPIHGNGSRSQWIDFGPPRTDIHPSAVPQRYYRITLLPE